MADVDSKGAIRAATAVAVVHKGALPVRWSDLVKFSLRVYAALFCSRAGWLVLPRVAVRSSLAALIDLA